MVDSKHNIKRKKDNRMKKSRIARSMKIMIVLVAIIASLAVPAYAADFDFSYIDWSKSEKTFTVYSDASNKKSYNGQEATVKGTNVECDSATNGWGFRVVYKGTGRNPVDITPSGYRDVTLRTYWLNGNYTIHPQYKSGYGGKGTFHYVAARLDDDSADGEYTFEGAFNSDYT